MSITVAVISSDMEYVTRMLSYMKGNPIYHTWRIQLYSIPDRILNLAELEQVDLILVEEAMVGAVTARIEAGGRQRNELGFHGKQAVVPIVVLAVERREGHEYELYKYQSVSSLLHQLLQRYERNSKRLSVKRNQDHLKKIAICSTLEQCGKTTMALHLATTIARRGYSVFYCNYETWNTSEYLLPQLAKKPSSSYSDFLYYVKSNPQQQAAKWLTEHAIMEPQHQLYTLNAFHHEADRHQLSSADAIKLLNSISDSGLYHYIIVDMPAGLNSWTLPVLDQCDLHYLLMQAGVDWQRKHELAIKRAEQQYEEVMQRLQCKTMHVLNEHNNYEGVGTPLHYDERLPYIEEWQQAGGTLFSSPAYRAAIETCAKELMTTGEGVR